MPKAKKFGAFAGVFTPSLLTILGVIMYLRLGWVVGQSGLIGAIAIILIAHLISITTGLSISSIATDKKIKVGGIYYMLSRSLGLPMGGAIGITIFVGTSLSIALYLVGFAENFLGIEVISSFLGLGNSANDIRIVGTAAILFLVMLAFVSTSLAIKSQFIILGAIALSLIAIIAGFITNIDIASVSVVLNPAPAGLPLETVFAIFFPAVTGFTVGVAMSGDLKDPKNSISKGTLWAIGVGLIVYLSLAVAFAFFVSRDVLLNDYNFLMNIALWAPLVIAGIWGATLSSALGGILGAPRILQAIARDKIFPAFFGKGYGQSNEPRNALMLTFLIAEAGILIGDLDVIARVVSMFYISAYGFINLAFTLENWASTDFRPSFKIPKWIGIVGFIASFAVMLKLDTVAMIMAILIMFSIYFFLTKKELQVDFGDVWQSVWSSIVRSSLSRLARKGLEERNWQPNIILFSGGTQARPHLIEFGMHLVGRKGFLSNFDLVQNGNTNPVPARHKQFDTVDAEFANKGIYTRKHACADIYEGIKNIAGTYGFAGIEPNTVMMGWGRHYGNPEKFLDTVNYLSALDLNILLMDYDKSVGFGKYSQVDIWWRTTEHNGNIALMLLKFLWLSEAWRNTKARILIVNPVNEHREIIYRNTHSIIENMRINADIKIINNQIEQRSFYEIVQVESVNSDLIFLGLPDIKKGDETTFVEETNKLCKDIGTVVLIKASTNFKELRIGIGRTLLGRIDQLEKNETQMKPATPLPEISYPAKEELSKHIRLLNADMMEINRYLISNYLVKLFGYQSNLISLIEDSTGKSFLNIREKVIAEEIEQQQKSIIKFESNLLFRFRKIISDFDQEIFEIQQLQLKESIEYFFREMEKVVLGVPKKIRVALTDTDLDFGKPNKTGEKFFIFSRKLLNIITAGSLSGYDFRYRAILSDFFYTSTTRLVYEMLEKWGGLSLQYAIKTRTILYRIASVFFELEKKATSGLSSEFIDEKQNEIRRELNTLKILNLDATEALKHYLITSINTYVGEFSVEIDRLNANRAFSGKYFDHQSTKSIRKFVLTIPLLWQQNQHLLFNTIKLELGLLAFTTKLRSIISIAAEEMSFTFESEVIAQEIEMRDQLTNFLAQTNKSGQVKYTPENFVELEQQESFNVFFNQLIEKTFRKIKLATSVLPHTIEIMAEDSVNNFYPRQFKNVETVNISVAELMDFILQTEFVEPLQKLVLEMSQKLENINSAINEVIRHLTFDIEKESENSKDGIPKPEKIIPLVEGHIRLLNKEIDKSAELKIQITNLLNERLNTFEDRLSYHSFIKSASNLRQYIRDIEIRRRWYFLQSLRWRTKSFVQHQLNQFWYRQSIGVMFTQRLRKESASARFNLNEAINFCEKVSIQPEISRKLPFYYSRLFVRKQYYLNEFWIGRKKELEEAEKALSRYKEKFNGGIMVLGDKNSGKTFFSQYFLNKYFQEASIYNLTAPYGGSADVKLFKESIESTFEVKGSYYRIFNSLPEHSVLIIDDLSLWWEKSENGLGVIDQIMELISKYSSKCLFVLSLEKHSFELINRIRHIENYFINTIELGAFNSEELQQIVMIRHQSSGFKLKLENSLREHLRPWDFARLFARYFSFSNGNAGVALTTWLANITDIEKNVITVAPPRTPDYSVLEHLKPDWYLLIVQLILHKRANLRKLSRISLESIQEIKGKIEILKRSGLIVESQPGIYEVNDYLYPHIQKILIEKDML
ncbi:MAG: hypothetical protein K9H16_00740 [Bacteroidales bacterium]|nr:hypothetical protein [Bacteroidales bacterium]